MLTQEDIDYGSTQQDVEELMESWDNWFNQSTHNSE